MALLHMKSINESNDEGLRERELEMRGWILEYVPPLQLVKILRIGEKLLGHVA